MFVEHCSDLVGRARALAEGLGGKMTTRKTRRTSASAPSVLGAVGTPGVSQLDGTPGVPEQATGLPAAPLDSPNAARSGGEGPKRPQWARNLTNRQYRFVQEYLLDLRAVSAVRRAFPALAGRAVYEEAQKHMHNAAVLSAIDEAVDTDYGITRSKIMQELAKIAFHNPLDYFSIGPGGVTLKDSNDFDPDMAAAIAEVAETTSLNGGSIKLKLSDKQAALEKLAKLVGANRQREQETRNTAPVNVMVVRFSDLTAAERAALRTAPTVQLRSVEDFIDDDRVIDVESSEVTEGSNTDAKQTTS